MPRHKSNTQQIVVLGDFKGFEQKLKITIAKVRSGRVRISLQLGDSVQIRVVASETLAPSQRAVATPAKHNSQASTASKYQ